MNELSETNPNQEKEEGNEVVVDVGQFREQVGVFYRDVNSLRKKFREGDVEIDDIFKLEDRLEDALENLVQVLLSEGLSEVDKNTLKEIYEMIDVQIRARLDRMIARQNLINGGAFQATSSTENTTAEAQETSEPDDGADAEEESELFERDKAAFEAENSDLIDFIDHKILNPTTPLKKLWIGEVTELSKSYSAHAVGVKSGYEDNAYFSQVFLQKMNRAESILQELVEFVENKDPKQMDWDEFAAEINYQAMDINNHAAFASAVADERRKELYNAFHDRKSGREDESYEQRLQRLHWATYIQLSKLEDVNQNEGEMPTCTRPDLIPEMRRRQIARINILTGITYHPDFGDLIREALKDLIVQVAKQEGDDGDEICYDNVTRSDKGRTMIRDYVRRNYRDRLKNDIFSDLDEVERNRSVDHVLEVIWKLYFAFDLLTVSFAELQKNTKTIVHGTKKGDQDVKDLDRVFISRPDAGLVHRLTRYDTMSDWSANYLPFLEEIPKDYGRGNSRGDMSQAEYDRLPEKEKKKIKAGRAEREKLVKLQELLIMQYDSYFDASLFTGANGIPATDLFHPLFPTSFDMLLLSDNEFIEREEGRYCAGGDVGEAIPYNPDPEDKKSGPKSVDNYELAEKGWNFMLKLVLGSIPDPVTHEMILEKAPTEGNDIDLGLIDQFIKKGAGLAKIVDGQHLENALAPFLTNYILRIFARYDASEEHRHATFLEVVEKLRESYRTGGGLSAHSEQIEEVIKRISAPNREGVEMSDSLRSGLYSRRKQRREYVDAVYIKDKKRIPQGGGFSTWVKNLGFDKVSGIEEQEYWDILNGKEPLPSTGVQREVSLVRIDEKG